MNQEGCEIFGYENVWSHKQKDKAPNVRLLKLGTFRYTESLREHVSWKIDQSFGSNP